MKHLQVGPLAPSDRASWDAFVEEAAGGFLFARSSYLQFFEDWCILGVYEGETLQLGFPVPLLATAVGPAVGRPSYLSPYFAPIFRPQEGRRVYVDRRRRDYLAALIAYLQATYASVVLPLHPSVADMQPFQEAHFNLELRYTYELMLDDPERLWQEMDARLRNHIRKAKDVRVVTDPQVQAFDFDAALFYEPKQERGPWRHLVHGLTQAGQGQVFIAYAGERPVGGLFLAYDAHAAYNLLSYFDRTAGVRGVPACLLWSAIRFALEAGLERFDFEGSVLPPIERFFQGFGGHRQPYFQVHWYADPSCQTPLLYHYE